jgi:hypothetical protein
MPSRKEKEGDDSGGRIYQPSVGCIANDGWYVTKVSCSVVVQYTCGEWGWGLNLGLLDGWRGAIVKHREFFGRDN